MPNPNHPDSMDYDTAADNLRSIGQLAAGAEDVVIAKEISFHGSSDDIVILDVFDLDGNELRSEEFAPPLGSGAFEHVAFNVGDRLKVRVVYDQHNGCWGVSVSPIEEGVKVPWNWPLKMEQGMNDYSMMLTILAPADVEVAVTEE